MATKVVSVFRVENSDGYGPYSYSGWQERPHNEGNGHPLPRQDGLDSFPRLYKFGFASLESLADWFSRVELMTLSQSYHYDIAEYSISSRMVRYGDKQVVFNAARASFVRDLSWRDLPK